MVLSEIDDEDIDSVEKFIKGDLLEIFQEKIIKIPYGCELEDCFGKLYAQNPNRFKFLPGDKKIIKQIIFSIKNNIGCAEMNNYKEPITLPITEMQALNIDSENENDSARRTNYFLRKLQATADLNAKRAKGGYRYDDEISGFASYLRMICGPLGYETIQRNLECALPSLTTTNRYISKSNRDIVEGVLRAEELLTYLSKRKLPLAVCLSEDATRIVGRIQYDVKTNQVVGFTLPLD